jgi:hypothetical protein
MQPVKISKAYFAILFAHAGRMFHAPSEQPE